jgi:hypothetical protein
MSNQGISCAVGPRPIRIQCSLSVDIIKKTDKSASISAVQHNHRNKSTNICGSFNKMLSVWENVEIASRLAWFMQAGIQFSAVSFILIGLVSG